MAVTQDELERMAAALGEVLQARGCKLATAESCTGGWVAQCCTAIAGSSAWFDRGFVTYSNAAKMSDLDVSEAQLLSTGAVSIEVAREMVAGVLVHTPADAALAITGIAGPGGGSLEKPVGTVCFAWGLRGLPVRAARCWFEGDRQSVRAQSVAYALCEMRALLLSNPG